MNRPEVRIISQQEETNSREVSGWEAEQLLRKYGQDQSFYNRPVVQQPQQPGLTFDQMVAQEEARLKQEQLRKHQQMMGPKFNGQNGYESEIRYGSDSDSGFGFKIEITTDMNLPKY